MLVAVDGAGVGQRTLDAIKQLTIGPEGSSVTLEMRRGQSSFTSTLQRVLPDDGGAGRP